MIIAAMKNDDYVPALEDMAATVGDIDGNSLDMTLEPWEELNQKHLLVNPMENAWKLWKHKDVVALKKVFWILSAPEHTPSFIRGAAKAAATIDKGRNSAAIKNHRVREGCADALCAVGDPGSIAVLLVCLRLGENGSRHFDGLSGIKAIVGVTM